MIIRKADNHEALQLETAQRRDSSQSTEITLAKLLNLFPALIMRPIVHKTTNLTISQGLFRYSMSCHQTKLCL